MNAPRNDDGLLFGSPAPREESRVLNGLRHRVLCWDAPAHSPTLVLLHGFLDVSWSFAPFAAAMRRAGEANDRASLRMMAPDLRGHGETERVGRGGYYHFPDYVADMLPLIESLPRPRHLLGHSMGGTVAALLTGTFPDLVDSLVLVEGLGPPAVQEEPPDRMAQWIRDVRAQSESESPDSRVRALPDLDAAAERLRRRNPRMGEELARLLAKKATRPVGGVGGGVGAGVGDGLVWAFDPLHRTRSPLGFTPEAFRSFLSRITVPTLVVEGSESNYPLWVGDDRVTAISTRREASIEGAGHMVHQDQPDALARMVEAFLAEHPRVDRGTRRKG